MFVAFFFVGEYFRESGRNKINHYTTSKGNFIGHELWDNKTK